MHEQVTIEQGDAIVKSRTLMYFKTLGEDGEQKLGSS
jgi:hypothetical protein